MHKVSGQTLYSNKIAKESQCCISAACQFLCNSPGLKKSTTYTFYNPPQLSDKTTAVLLTPLDLSLHVLTLNIKSSNLITLSTAAEKGGWCHGEYLLWLISHYRRAEQIQPNSQSHHLAPNCTPNIFTLRNRSGGCCPSMALPLPWTTRPGPSLSPDARKSGLYTTRLYLNTTSHFNSP